MNEIIIGLSVGIISVIIGEIIVMGIKAEDFTMFVAYNLVNIAIGSLLGALTFAFIQFTNTVGGKNVLIGVGVLALLVVLKICLYALNQKLHGIER